MEVCQKRNGNTAFETKVPYSIGSNRPALMVPADACDAHHHIYDPVRFPYANTSVQPPATTEAYRLLQKRLGLERNVIVTPSAYGTDNSCTLTALKKMGKDARAVVVIDNLISDSMLEEMNRMGVCGIRINVCCGDSGEPRRIKTLADRIAPLGWHISFWMNANLTVEMKDFLKGLPCPVVFDHRGHLPAAEGIRHEAFRIITGLMKEKKAYVKLSALYHDSIKEDYADTIRVGKAYIEAAPDQVLWGTDWPHPGQSTTKRGLPNDADLLDYLLVQAGDQATVHKILVDNPARLFRWPKSR